MTWAAEYPATLEIPYPERLSRGLVLVKWWLLAIPHYLVVAVLVGGTALAVHGAPIYAAPYTGLITVLVLVAALAVLFTRHYPRGIFDLVMGLNRWVFRVLAYVLLLRDEYPPFRISIWVVVKQPAPQVELRRRRPTLSASRGHGHMKTPGSCHDAKPSEHSGMRRRHH